MGQHLPDRLFWAREERDAHADESAEAVAKDASEPHRHADARGTH
jgi:hypothetical protein